MIVKMCCKTRPSGFFFFSSLTTLVVRRGEVLRDAALLTVSRPPLPEWRGGVDPGSAGREGAKLGQGASTGSRQASQQPMRRAYGPKTLSLSPLGSRGCVASSAGIAGGRGLGPAWPGGEEDNDDSERGPGSFQRSTGRQGGTGRIGCYVPWREVGI